MTDGAHAHSKSVNRMNVLRQLAAQILALADDEAKGPECREPAIARTPPAFFNAESIPARNINQNALILPDPQALRRHIYHRQLRGRFFDMDLFADPAWDMLLDLTAALGERKRVSVTSLCIASGVPPTTALRWIGQMTEAELLTRVEDDNDRRRAFIHLTEKAVDALAGYFDLIGFGKAVSMPADGCIHRR